MFTAFVSSSSPLSSSPMKSLGHAARLLRHGHTIATGSNALEIAHPMLPPPPSWYPGHMSKFAKALPALLTRTDVVLELRDARLPLTSINRTLEGAIQRWKQERERLKGPTTLTSEIQHNHASPVCERIVVFNKRDLVAQWGVEPFLAAMRAKFPDQRFLFASWHRQKDIQSLSRMLVDLARDNPSAPELNVLVVGMPNVGKSTLLNALRNAGIKGPVSKALQTSALPGMTRALSTRLKLSQDPLIYSYDSPGVMMPFLGRDDSGAERGAKLALIAGIKEGLYDSETLASYLLYRFNLLNPNAPAYLTLLPEGSQPTQDVNIFLEALAKRLGMIGRGATPDIQRAATWFIRWWREEGGLLSVQSSSPSSEPTTQCWGFDLEWQAQGSESAEALEEHMTSAIERFLLAEEEEFSGAGGVSGRQEKLREKADKMAKSAARARALLAARKSGGGGGKKRR